MACFLYRTNTEPSNCVLKNHLLLFLVLCYRKAMISFEYPQTSAIAWKRKTNICNMRCTKGRLTLCALHKMFGLCPSLTEATEIYSTLREGGRKKPRRISLVDLNLIELSWESLQRLDSGIKKISLLSKFFF